MKIGKLTIEQHFIKKYDYINLQYLKRYENFIEKCYKRNINLTDEVKPFTREVHHILPKSCFKRYINVRANLISLTCEEHFKAHLLLTTLCNNKNKSLLYAFNMMNCKRPHKMLYSKLYAEAKEEYYRMLSKTSKRKFKIINRQRFDLLQKLREQGKYNSKELKKEKNRNLKHSDTLRNKPKKYWEEVVKKRNDTLNNRSTRAKNLESKRKSTKTKESWERIKQNKRKYNKIKKSRRENAKRQWQKMTKKQRLEHNRKNSEGQKRLPFLTCPHCGFKSRSVGNMKYWHMDNCLKNPNLTKKQLKEIIERRETRNRNNGLAQRKRNKLLKEGKLK